MKKTLLTSLIAILAFVAPAFAENPARPDLAASAQGSKESPLETKKSEIKLPLTKKQKTEADLRSTSHRLSLVVDRTQALLDLLTKKNKDTSDAQTALDKTNALLEEANSAIDQFAGIVPLEIKSENPTDETTELKEVVIFKDPLKKAQESLKFAKASLLESITALKDILAQKEVSE